MRTIYRSFVLFISLLITVANSPAQIRSELSETPPMGWNSWNYHGKQDINEQVILETIDAIVEENLLDAGYNYLVIDGGWRDTCLERGGKLLPHPVKFPNGIKPLVDYAHSRGLKFGLHVVPGTHDCGGDPIGAHGVEAIHLKQFVEWELDFIKLDLCKQAEDPCCACQKNKGGWSEQNIEETYRKWSNLLNGCGRDILFSISAYQYRSWYPEVCNMARTTGDILSRIHRGGARFNLTDSIKMELYSVLEIAESNNLASDKACNGYWNDPDMMVTGKHGLSRNEQESHFALWCMMSSPLFLGNDPRNMTAFEKELILNREMIAVNQDPTEQGKIVKKKNNTQVWAKELRDGKMAVLLLNIDPAHAKDIQLDFKDIGLKDRILARDIVNKKDLGEFTDSLTLIVEPNQCRFLLLSR